MSCYRTPEGHMIRNRHVEACGSPQDCDGCQPCPQPHCLVCRRDHGRVSCPACLASTRIDLAGVVRLSGRLEDEALHGARSAHSDAPGGDALVLAGPAATERGYAGQLLHRLRFGLDVSHTSEELKTDPTPPLAVLMHWEDRWRRGSQHHTELTPSVARSAAFLDRWMHEAARDIAFVPFSRALTSLVAELEAVLSAGEQHNRTRVPCWDCGTRLVKVYADTETEDYWTCPRCGERYDRGRYDRAKHDHLASEGADRYVYVADAAAAIGRPEQTLRAWMRNGIVTTARDPKTNRMTVWWPDVREANRARGSRNRKAKA